MTDSKSVSFIILRCTSTSAIWLSTDEVKKVYEQHKVEFQSAKFGDSCEITDGKIGKFTPPSVMTRIMAVKWNNVDFVCAVPSNIWQTQWQSLTTSVRTSEKPEAKHVFSP